MYKLLYNYYAKINIKEVNSMKNRIKITPLSRISSLIIKIGMPIIAVVFIYILQLLLNTPENEKAWLYANAYTMLEYAVMSFTLVFCGALVTDMALKHK